MDLAPYFDAARFVAAIAILAFVIMPRTVDRQ